MAEKIRVHVFFWNLHKFLFFAIYVRFKQLRTNEQLQNKFWQFLQRSGRGSLVISTAQWQGGLVISTAQWQGGLVITSVHEYYFKNVTWERSQVNV